MPQITPISHPVILFDGVCNLCTASVQFVIRHDPAERFRFASLQSAKAKELLAGHLANESTDGSFVLVEKNRIYTRSTAALRVARKLKGAWPLLYVCILIPPFIRNAVYNLISQNRYRWFGQKQTCWLPAPEWEKRFID